jgi:membrane protein YdbS with pleckstrin-like domain
MRALPTRKLDKRITRVWRLSATVNVIIWSLLVLAGTGIPWLALSGSTETGDRSVAAVFGLILIIELILALLALIISVVIVPKVRWLQWRFEVYNEEIDIQKGIFWRRRIIIPLIRVQNVDTQQGPIMRANGLASFTVSTAAGAHEIPGLDVAEADALRDHVALLARIAQEDV